MLSESEKLCVELEGLMAEKRDLDMKLANSICKVHKYLCEQEKGEGTGWPEGDGPPRFQDDEEL